MATLTTLETAREFTIEFKLTPCYNFLKQDPTLENLIKQAASLYIRLRTTYRLDISAASTLALNVVLDYGPNATLADFRHDGGII